MGECEGGADRLGAAGRSGGRDRADDRGQFDAQGGRRCRGGDLDPDPAYRRRDGREDEGRRGPGGGGRRHAGRDDPGLVSPTAWWARLDTFAPCKSEERRWGEEGGTQL